MKNFRSWKWSDGKETRETGLKNFRSICPSFFFSFSFSFFGGERTWTIDVPSWWSWSCARFGISWGLASRLHGNELGKVRRSFEKSLPTRSEEPFTRVFEDGESFRLGYVSSFDRCLTNTLFSLSARCNRTEQRIFTLLPPHVALLQRQANSRNQILRVI